MQTQQLNEETTVVLFDNSIQEKIDEKEATINEMNERLKSRENEIAKLHEEMYMQKTQNEKRNEEQSKLFQELMFEKEQLEAEKAEQSHIEAEVEQVFQADKESKWKEQIEDLENALQRKNELIQQLQDRQTDESTSEPHTKKRMVT